MGKKKDNNLLYFGIIIMTAILIIGGYFLYFSISGKTTVQDIDNRITNRMVDVLAEKKDEPIETIADQEFETEEDLSTALDEIDEIDLDELEDGLNIIDSDSSSL